ncbi:MAG: BNR-4 repeat-containing protein [Bryobacterales bacterium]|nr:BNR-4 repeat-containing protein [Bryobacterales bacterium]
MTFRRSNRREFPALPAPMSDNSGMHCLMLLAASVLAAGPLPKDDGYRGIWYFNQPSNDPYVYKYSGGFATYPQQHAPIAIYAKQVNKTFFVYGGTTKGKHNELVHMVSYFDHIKGTVPRPTILLNKKTDDAHDNPTLSIDDAGYLWIFSAAHGTSRPAYVHKSKKPYSIDEFEQMWETNFSYPQPWYISGRGFLFLHTRYLPLTEGKGSGRALHWRMSPDGDEWNAAQLVAFAQMGHYQISWPNGQRVGTAFDVHPTPTGLNARTNLYYMETKDLGWSWQSVDGKRIQLPLRETENAALVRDYRKEGQLVYLKDLQYDEVGRPIIVLLTSKGYESGPKNDPRTFHTARWTGRDWDYLPITRTDHNYDHGSLYVERGGQWRFIAPTAPGPQAYATGGEIEMWVSQDRGRKWTKQRVLTSGSKFNHTYVRRPLNANPEFYAMWADGDAFKPSESRLYFANQKGDVFQLPAVMKDEYERPVRISQD